MSESNEVKTRHKAGLIDRQTAVPIGSAAAVIGVVIVGLTMLNTWLSDFETRMLILEGGVADRYTLTQAAEDALRNAIANPTLRFHDPRNPGEYITVGVMTKKTQN